MKTKNPIHFGPPRFGQWLLRRITVPDIQYSALGDFEEIFVSIVKEKNFRQARRWYWNQIIRSIPFFLVDLVDEYWEAIRGFLSSARKGFSENQAHSLINLISLIIGIFCCILVLLNIQNRLGYDHIFEYINPNYSNNERNSAPEKIIYAAAVKEKSEQHNYFAAYNPSHLNASLSHSRPRENKLIFSSWHGRTNPLFFLNCLSIMVLFNLLLSSFIFVNYTASRSKKPFKKTRLRIATENQKLRTSRNVLVESFFLMFLFVVFGLIVFILFIMIFIARKDGILPNFKINTSLFLGIVLVTLCWINFWNLSCHFFPPFKSDQ